MALNICEMSFNGIKIAFFSKKLQIIAQQLGASPPDPRLWHVWVTLAFSKRLQSYAFALFNYISLSPLSLQNPGKVPTGKFLMTSLHVICGLPEKLFWRPFLFWEHLRLCPWPWAFLSLASRGSVLGKDVFGLGLGFFLCPWPRALCPRLHLCWL